MGGRRFHLLTALGASVALLCGCEKLTNVGDGEPARSWEDQTNLSATYGGYQFKSEAPAFNDPEVRMLDAEESALAVADPDTLPQSRSAFAVRILWGQLKGNPDAATVVTWDGAFVVSSGGLAVLRAIAFEPPADRVLPRTDRQIVEFESKTRPHFDGLLLLIHDLDNDPNATLTMRTGPYTNSWTFAELREADLVIPVDDLGNAVSLCSVARPDRPLACPAGAVRGHWQVREGARGVFRALWMSQLGRPLGHIRGHFGVNDNGQRVWFGKIIGRRGELIGLARGTYAPSEDPAMPAGSFSGQFSAREGEITGHIRGHYLAGRQGAAGFLHARWQANCDGEQPADPSAE